ncbi:MAG: DUF4012 domain-containing protein, partial [Ktedonobacteraceae bacterium]|nr:DUF4012 domain-containing protein [Ktedonobacteraceae bacterium]
MGIVQHVRIKERRKIWSLYLLLICLLFLCGAASFFSVMDYQIYGTQILRTVTEEHEGVAHMKKAQALLSQFAQHAADIGLIDESGKEFGLARSSFTRLDNDLHGFPVISTHLPFLNTRLYAGKHLVPLSIWMARAGIEICDGIKTLLTRFQDPLKAQGSGITQSDLDFIGSKVHKIRQFVEAALAEARQLRTSDVSYDARTAALFESFQKTVPSLYTWLADIELALPVLPALLGVSAPANYLLELLDSAELRPGGGVIGNYGFATFSGGKMTGMRIIDVNMLDHPFTLSGKQIPYPIAYQWFGHFLSSRSWNLRDANLDADFPTSARYAELNYAREGGKVPVQGVIAITPALIQRLLSLSGANHPTSLRPPATARAAALFPYQPTSVLVPLAQAAVSLGMTQLHDQRTFSPAQWSESVPLSQLLQVLLDSMRSKDLQVYFNSSVAEDMLLHHQLAST